MKNIFIFLETTPIPFLRILFCIKVVSCRAIRKTQWCASVNNETFSTAINISGWSDSDPVDRGGKK